MNQKWTQEEIIKLGKLLTQHPVSVEGRTKYTKEFLDHFPGRTRSAVVTRIKLWRRAVKNGASPIPAPKSKIVKETQPNKAFDEKCATLVAWMLELAQDNLLGAMKVIKTEDRSVAQKKLDLVKHHLAVKGLTPILGKKNEVCRFTAPEIYPPSETDDEKDKSNMESKTDLNKNKGLCHELDSILGEENFKKEPIQEDMNESVISLSKFLVSMKASKKVCMWKSSDDIALINAFSSCGPLWTVISKKFPEELRCSIKERFKFLLKWAIKRYQKREIPNLSKIDSEIDHLKSSLKELNCKNKSLEDLLKYFPVLKFLLAPHKSPTVLSTATSNPTSLNSDNSDDDEDCNSKSKHQKLLNLFKSQNPSSPKPASVSVPCELSAQDDQAKPSGSEKAS
ncbi:unnamed protein product [Moneuplotes crassus]|uniref:Uncharacterized protein n=1 Tax=Euplotes crassus TaxID=5936 RepID=A0AAD2CWD3_EUPCR|nr:unnamed protein product [Moneuplotes crassus]